MPDLPHGAAPGQPVPSSTYRVQLRPDFGFAALGEQVDYLAELGVSHVYLSPILQAVPGSTHGYDVLDHTRLSDDLGGGLAFAELRTSLGAADLGAVADVVPNHIAVPTPESLNPALWSVLRDGPASPYAHWFDVDWTVPDHALLMPVLGRRIGDCLAAGEITVDTSGPEPVVRYFDHVLPVRPGTEQLDLAELLDAQWYRLAYWRVADEELNYRRFFDVDTLAGLRVEHDDVFAESHALLIALLLEGGLDGLRIDHPDGLADPRAYLRRLARATGHSWVVVEKILEGEEPLPADWPCAGTTGYDAIERVGGVFVDGTGRTPLITLHSELTGEPADFGPVRDEAKRQIVEHVLYAEVNRLVELAAAICHEDITLRDHTRSGLREALVELLVAVPVYRAYVVPGEEPPSSSVQILTAAADVARARLTEERQGTLDLVRVLALSRLGRDQRRDEFVTRFQQTCGPVMAKGVEDTAFYRWCPLVALAEVGGDPTRFGVTPDEFHDWCAHVQRDRPVTMTTLSTHDTKRSEDVRARLHVLSELPGDWARTVTSWRAQGAELSPASERPDAGMEYLLWQTLVGAWPVDVERLTSYAEKAAREAKVHTSWVSPDERYESALRGFVTAVLGSQGLRRDIDEFVERLSPYFRVNVLGQKLVQLTMPGVPDVYQGSELVWLALVDPDNRRPVDYAARRRLLAVIDGGAAPRSLDEEKLLVVSRALRLRREHPEWFGSTATYVPVPASSPHALAFCRSGRVITVVTRLAVGLEQAGGWGAATLTLPEGRWVDQLSDTTYTGGPVALADLLGGLPVALLSNALVRTA